jgi:hypothetical protein
VAKLFEQLRGRLLLLLAGQLHRERGRDAPLLFSGRHRCAATPRSTLASAPFVVCLDFRTEQDETCAMIVREIRDERSQAEQDNPRRRLFTEPRQWVSVMMLGEILLVMGKDWRQKIPSEVGGRRSL